MKSEQISTYLQSRIEAKDFPSAVYLIAERDEILFQDALGFAVIEPEKIEAKTDTIYDLASLTKPLVAGLLAAKLIERGELKLSDKIATYFSEFDSVEKREISVKDLLTHRAGFTSWLPFYLISGSASENLNYIASRSLENPVRSKVVYGDPNFLILTALIEKVYAAPINEATRTEIIAPLALENTFFNPPESLRRKIAASERGNEFEKELSLSLGFDIGDYNWREYRIWGEIHDVNCHFMNGVSGHAGLFSNAHETFRIAQQFLAEETVLLNAETCKLFRTNFTEDLNEARSISFQLAATDNSTAGKLLSKDSFGHLGFTGTSLWIDPTKERIYILLTNRTHARDLPFANINDTRRQFHELAAQVLGE